MNRKCRISQQFRGGAATRFNITFKTLLTSNTFGSLSRKKAPSSSIPGFSLESTANMAANIPPLQHRVCRVVLNLKLINYINLYFLNSPFFISNFAGGVAKSFLMECINILIKRKSCFFQILGRFLLKYNIKTHHFCSESNLFSKV